jgi:hypothetical protein
MVIPDVKVEEEYSKMDMSKFKSNVKREFNANAIGAGYKQGLAFSHVKGKLEG